VYDLLPKVSGKLIFDYFCLNIKADHHNGCRIKNWIPICIACKLCMTSYAESYTCRRPPRQVFAAPSQALRCVGTSCRPRTKRRYTPPKPYLQTLRGHVLIPRARSAIPCLHFILPFFKKQELNSSETSCDN
jgi:hypothetical protein